MEYILASAEHDHVVIDHYLAVWESYGTPADYLREDAEEVVRQFLHEGRRERKLASFMAFEGMRPVGSISSTNGKPEGAIPASGAPCAGRRTRGLWRAVGLMGRPKDEQHHRLHL
jgi:hypothetical protein